MKTRSHAFTLVEVLVVVAIVVIVAAISVSVLSQGKKRAHMAGTLSNLRQCYIAMSLYMADEDFAKLPSGASANAMLAGAPIKDNLDNWKVDPNAGAWKPLIGSYAYVRNVAPLDTDDGWSGWWGDLQPNHNVLMVSIFSGLDGVGYETDGLGQVLPIGQVWPKRYHQLLSDGSVKVVNVPSRYTDTAYNSTQMGFSWLTIFARRLK